MDVGLKGVRHTVPPDNEERMGSCRESGKSSHTLIQTLLFRQSNFSVSPLSYAFKGQVFKPLKNFDCVL